MLNYLQKDDMNWMEVMTLIKQKQQRSLFLIDFFLSLWEHANNFIGMSSRILGEFEIVLRFSEFAVNYFNMNTIFIKFFKCYAVHIHFIALHPYLIIHVLIFVSNCIYFKEKFYFNKKDNWKTLL